ncbi:DUF4288 domain-containing protein [Paractinoplanes durhamensis]|uniref:DUF4288 domain-containing protein n=1 Tax=Paractinoplanes durhamensis TaxID=113563 RepID=A0ABQ3ZBD3_9ACTN|nr:DUF4288 domain-containing protein [Actinoplanes durhamensis]GIE07134.1 hypothetical protein Adu01nite_84840 [Actinoplanes durhamensis]
MTVWFSTSMRFAEYTDDTTFFRYRTSVYLLRAADHEAARVRAVEIGREQERTYRNAEGALFRTALVGVDTLDMLGDLEDGVEVAHWPGEEIEPPVAWGHEFHPEDDSEFYTTL